MGRRETNDTLDLVAEEDLKTVYKSALASSAVGADEEDLPLPGTFRRSDEAFGHVQVGTRGDECSLRLVSERVR